MLELEKYAQIQRIPYTRSLKRASMSVKAVVIFFLFIVISSLANSIPKCGIKKFNEYQIQYCLYEGDGPLFVLEGAQGNDMSVWPHSFLHRLNQLGELLIYNRIGYKKSYYYKNKIIHSVSAKSVAENLQSLLHQLKINKQIIMIGHSIGGLYAQYFVRNYPENMAALVLIDADSSFEPKKNSPFQSKIADKKGSTAYFESTGFNQSMDQVNKSAPFPNIPLLVITATNHGSPKETEELWQQLQREIVKQSAQGEQIIAQGSGHFIFQDDPDLIISSIDKLIKNNNIK